MLDISPDKEEHLDGSILEEKRIYDEKKKIDLFLFTRKNYVKNLNKDLAEQTKNFESSIIESKNSEIELENHRRKLARLKQKVNELQEKINESKYSIKRISKKFFLFIFSNILITGYLMSIILGFVRLFIVHENSVLDYNTPKMEELDERYYEEEEEGEEEEEEEED
jgi:hypothetical protein